MKTAIFIILLVLLPLNIKAEILSDKCRNILLHHYSESALQLIEEHAPNKPEKTTFPIEPIAVYCTTAQEQNQIGIIIMGGGNYIQNIIFTRIKMLEAESWFKKSIENGSINAIYNLAKLYKEMNTDKTKHNITNLYQTAANLGHEPSKYELGKQLIKIHAYKKAYSIFTELANQGHAGANYQIGRMMSKGLYLQKNQRKSLKYFKYSAKAGDTNAIKYLINIYSYGTGGVYINPKQVNHWTTLLSEKTHEKLQYSLYKHDAQKQLNRIINEKHLEYLY
jgi:TPR repeat protein